MDFSRVLVSGNEDMKFWERDAHKLNYYYN